MTIENLEKLSTSLAEPLARLVAFEPTPFPVISVYLNTQPNGHGRDSDPVPYLQREFKALARTWAASSPERTSFERDVERITRYVTDEIEPAANGVVIFASNGASEFFEALQLTAPVSENRIYIYNQPHLYHLARLNEEYPRYAAVVTDSNSARIYIFGLGQTIAADELKGKKVHRVKVGGWSQARYQRRVGNAHQEHAKELIERLEVIVRDDQVTRIVICGDSVIVPLLQENMPQQLQPLVEVIKLDLHASEQDVMRATLQRLHDQSSEEESAKVARLLDQYRAHGLAVAGLEETLTALANGQVDELLVSAELERDHSAHETIDAIIAPEIPDASGGTESDEPRSVSLPDLLVTKAQQTNAAISFVKDPELLKSVDGVGAFLRWRA